MFSRYICKWCLVKIEIYLLKKINQEPINLKTLLKRGVFLCYKKYFLFKWENNIYWSIAFFIMIDVMVEIGIVSLSKVIIALFVRAARDV